MLTAPDPLPEDVATLQALDQMIETLKAQLTVLRRRQFGQHSEKLGRTADQLALQIEELEQHQAQRAVAAGAPMPSDMAQAAGSWAKRADHSASVKSEPK